MGDTEKALAITKSMTLKVKATGMLNSLEGKVWAVNWLNLKRPWLYDLYGKLAFIHVAKAGAKLFFKGNVIEKLEGEDMYDRELLLIVRYPSVDGFLNMLSNKWFQLKSILRINAIKRFVFGFVKQEGGSGQALKRPVNYEGSNCYMVHIFQTDPVYADDKTFQALIDSEQPELYFQGTQKAKVIRVQKGKEQEGPFFIDGILIWEAADQKTLKDWANSEAYEAFKKLNQSNNLYLLDRTI